MAEVIAALQAAESVTKCLTGVFDLAYQLKQGADEYRYRMTELFSEADSLKIVVDNVQSCLRLSSIQALAKQNDDSATKIFHNLTIVLGHCIRATQDFHALFSRHDANDGACFNQRAYRAKLLDMDFTQFSEARSRLATHVDTLQMSLSAIHTHQHSRFELQQRADFEQQGESIRELKDMIAHLTTRIESFRRTRDVHEATLIANQTTTAEATRVFIDQDALLAVSMQVKATADSQVRMHEEVESRRQDLLGRQKQGQSSSMMDLAMSAKANSLLSSVPVQEPDLGALRRHHSAGDDVKSMLQVTAAGHRTDAIEQLIAMTKQKGYNPKVRLADKDVDSIARYLRAEDRHEWAERPRTYFILRLINKLDYMRFFVRDGVKDISFPYTAERLPPFITSHSVRHDFLKWQTLVLNSRSTDLIKGGKHRHLDDRRIADTIFTSVRSLGKGGQGVVDVVRHKMAWHEYARKRFSRSKAFAGDRKTLNIFENEIHNLKRLSHDHLVKFVGSYTDINCVAIIMDPVADCDLKEYMQAVVEDNFDSYRTGKLRSFFGCLAAAVEYLHQEKCRHKDIKPGNILVKNDTVLLTDFGIAFDSSELDSDITMSTVPSYTTSYAAPEILAQNGRRSFPSDIYALGLVFLDIMTILKHQPLTARDQFSFEIGVHVHTSGHTPKSLRHWMSNLEQIDTEANEPFTWIGGMIAFMASDRPDAAQVLAKIRNASFGDGLYCAPCCMAEDLETMSQGSWRGSESDNETLDFTTDQAPAGAGAHDQQSDAKSPDMEHTDESGISNATASVTDHSFSTNSGTQLSTPPAQSLELTQPNSASPPLQLPNTPSLGPRKDANKTPGKQGSSSAFQRLANATKEPPGLRVTGEDLISFTNTHDSSVLHDQSFALKRTLEGYEPSQIVDHHSESIADSTLGTRVPSSKTTNQHLVSIRENSQATEVNTSAVRFKPVALPTLVLEQPILEIKVMTICDLIYDGDDSLEDYLVKQRRDLGEWFSVCLGKITDVSYNIWSETILHLCVKFKDEDLAIRVIESIDKTQIDVNTTNIAGHTALHIAARQKRLAVVKALLDIGADLMAIDRRLRTPLHHAVMSGSVAVVKILVKRLSIAQCDINCADDLGITALHAAVRQNCFTIMYVLIDAGADPLRQSRHGENVFTWCRMEFRTELKRAITIAQMPGLITAADEAFTAKLASRNHCEVSQMIEAFSDVRTRDGELLRPPTKDFSSLLQLAQLTLAFTPLIAVNVMWCGCDLCKSFSHDPEQVVPRFGRLADCETTASTLAGYDTLSEWLLENQKSCLCVECAPRFEKLAQDVLTQWNLMGPMNSYVFQPNNAWKAFSLKVWKQQVYALEADAIARFLLQHGASYDLRDISTDSILDNAIQRNNLWVVASLRDIKGSIGPGPRLGHYKTMLTKAIDAGGNPYLVNYLVKNYSCSMFKHISPRAGHSVLHLVLTSWSKLGHLLPILLMYHGLEAFWKDSILRADHPILHALKSGNLEATRLLVEAGAPINLRLQDYDGLVTPLELAIESKKLECIEYLVRLGGKVTGPRNTIAEAILSDDAEVIHGLLDLRNRLLRERGEKESSGKFFSRTLNSKDPDSIGLARASDADGKLASSLETLDLEPANSPAALHYLSLTSTNTVSACFTRLLACNIDINVQDGQGDTPLHWAALHGTTYTVVLLEEHGARLDVVNKHGMTAARYAQLKKRKEVVEILGEVYQEEQVKKK